MTRYPTSTLELVHCTPPIDNSIIKMAKLNENIDQDYQVPLCKSTNQQFYENDLRELAILQEMLAIQEAAKTMLAASQPKESKKKSRSVSAILIRSVISYPHS